MVRSLAALRVGSKSWPIAPVKIELAATKNVAKRRQKIVAAVVVHRTQGPSTSPHFTEAAVTRAKSKT